MTPLPDIKRYPTALNPTQNDLIFAHPHFFVFLPTHNWHIWLCPTQTLTLRKAKRANFLPTHFQNRYFPKKYDSICRILNTYFGII